MSTPVPAVSVITPVYNTAEFLAECIEGVLGQTFQGFEYIVADNASTDGSADIAERYAREDPRMRVVRFEEHLPQIPNYNRALRLAHPQARYCKVALADDVLLPECLQHLVAMGDSDPGIGLMGAYTILQNRVFLDGLDFYEGVVDGDEVVRRYLEDGR